MSVRSMKYGIPRLFVFSFKKLFYGILAVESNYCVNNKLKFERFKFIHGFNSIDLLEFGPNDRIFPHLQSLLAWPIEERYI